MLGARLPGRLVVVRRSAPGGVERRHGDVDVAGDGDGCVRGGGSPGGVGRGDELADGGEESGEDRGRQGEAGEEPA